ncbi:hypothetical protein EX30DRAFT_114756 [Ascodesmis nigricans]|uniref:Uncharacterized protein n=1 Tax=Ascodesmis nigricans TaxID=341454 RepID=A0A4S2MPW3_9PEZI|nr:hypothetical protein EX30DRAFT_114756 [Ascodesmis nigricans]
MTNWNTSRPLNLRPRTPASPALVTPAPLINDSTLHRSCLLQFVIPHEKGAPTQPHIHKSKELPQ